MLVLSFAFRKSYKNNYSKLIFNLQYLFTKKSNYNHLIVFLFSDS